MFLKILRDIRCFVLKMSNGCATDPEAAATAGADSKPALFYGWWSWRPRIMQRFLSAKWALFWLCWAGAMQGVFVNSRASQ